MRERLTAMRYVCGGSCDLLFVERLYDSTGKRGWIRGAAVVYDLMVSKKWE